MPKIVAVTRMVILPTGVSALPSTLGEAVSPASIITQAQCASLGKTSDRPP